MPLVRRWRGRRVAKTRRRDPWIWVRLAAVPQEDILAEWVRLTPEAYCAERTCVYQPAVVDIVHSGGIP